MNETVAQGFFIHFDDRKDAAHIGAAVMLRDETLAVAGLVGVIPAAVAKQLINAASRADVKVTIVACDGPEKIVALTWGDMDPVALWPFLAHGIAVSATRAFLMEAEECGMGNFGDIIDVLGNLKD